MLTAVETALLLGTTPQAVYAMAARGQLYQVSSNTVGGSAYGVQPYSFNEYRLFSFGNAP